MRCRAFVKVPAVAVLALLTAGSPSAALSADFSGSDAVGSWFGKAVQLCAAGAAPSACANGQPAVTMFLTSTLSADGLYVGDDSLLASGTPLAPHTSGHGEWFMTSPNQFVADYVYFAAAFPPVPNSTGAYRARWVGQIADHNTILGFINLYTTPPLPQDFQRLGATEFPALPQQVGPIIAPAPPFYFDPNLCLLSAAGACPRVFKFTLLRVGP